MQSLHWLCTVHCLAVPVCTSTRISCHVRATCPAWFEPPAQSPSSWVCCAGQRWPLGTRVPSPTHNQGRAPQQHSRAGRGQCSGAPYRHVTTSVAIPSPSGMASAIARAALRLATSMTVTAPAAARRLVPPFLLPASPLRRPAAAGPAAQGAAQAQVGRVRTPLGLCVPATPIPWTITFASLAL
jgi:hypothetical protein